MKTRFAHSSLSTFLALAVSAAAFVPPSPARAGVVIKGEQRPAGGDSGTSSSVSISEGKARTDSTINGQKMTMIYRGDKDLFWIIDDSAKTYREMTRADMKKIMEQVDKAMQQMKEQMASMPPEQRKMMEKMMGNQLVALDKKEAAPAITYVKVGDGGKVGGWSTVKYEGKSDGTKVSEVWAAPASIVKIGPAEMKTLENMMGFFREVVGKFGAGSFTALGPESGLDGVPLKVMNFIDGAQAGTYIVTSIEQRNLPASDFEVPPGFAKQSLQMPGMQ